MPYIIVHDDDCYLITGVVPARLRAEAGPASRWTCTCEHPRHTPGGLRFGGRRVKLVQVGDHYEIQAQ